MIQKKINMLAYVLVIVTIAAWSGVAYFVYVIQNMQGEYASKLDEVAQASDQAASAARLHVLASENLVHSASLDALVAPDVSQIIGTIKSVGDATRVAIKISDALPGTVPKNQKDIHAVAFIIEGTGTFSAVMHALEKFEVLPMPSSIDMVDIAEIPDSGSTSGAQQWHMSIKMQVLTTADVSS